MNYLHDKNGNFLLLWTKVALHRKEQIQSKIILTFNILFVKRKGLRIQMYPYQIPSYWCRHRSHLIKSIIMHKLVSIHINKLSGIKLLELSQISQVIRTHGRSRRHCGPRACLPGCLRCCWVQPPAAGGRLLDST